MKTSKLFKSGDEGQVLTLAILTVGLVCTLLLCLFEISTVVQRKIRLQLTADMAVLSVLNHQANSLNSISLSNRAILANDALASQLNALSCESRFYRKFSDRFQRYLQFIPYAAPALKFIAKGAKSIELFLSRTASTVLPLCRGSNSILSRSQQFNRAALPLSSLNAARESIQENMPGSQILSPSSLLLIAKAREIQESLRPIAMEKIAPVRKATMDNHTLKRNWRVSLGGMSPVKKTGGISLYSDDILARDKLQIKVFRRLRWRWKTVLSEKNLASNFGYRSPDHLMTLDTGKNSRFTLPLALEWNFQTRNGKEKALLALSAGSIFYNRKSRPTEGPNVFNPFWQSRLIPVSYESTAKRIIPKVLLKEIKH
jgi:hypothetical protein